MTPESDTNSHASDESYKYPNDKLDNDLPLNIEKVNKGNPDSGIQPDHFQDRDHGSREGEFNNDDGNDEDYVSIDSTNSISIHSANATDKNTWTNNKIDIDILHAKNDDAGSTTSEALKQAPKELHYTLDGEYWSHVGFLIDDTMHDLAVNLDRFYWGDNNEIGEDAPIVLSVIIQYPPIEPNYVLAAMYRVEPTVTASQQHACKATPQYGFHKGMKEFADEGREKTKQELYKNLLGMDAVTFSFLNFLRHFEKFNVIK